MKPFLKYSFLTLAFITLASTAHAVSAFGTGNPANLQTTKSDKEYVQLIKDMYAEIQKIGLINCVSRERTGSVDYAAGKMPVDQRAQRCILTDRYTVKKSTLDNLWETGVQMNAYFVNDKLFFAYIETINNSNYSVQYRFYFAPTGRLIQILVKSADSEEIASAPNTLLTDQKEIDENLVWMKECLKQTDDILNGTR